MQSRVEPNPLTRWALERLDQPEVPDTLYHYTDEAGLRGILGSSSLRAGHIRHLNDREEFAHFAGLVIEALRRKAPEEWRWHEWTIDERWEDELYGRFLEAAVKTSTDPRLFVASLTRKPDDLSQWRGYCPIPGGYAIGFDPRGFQLGRRRFRPIRACQYPGDGGESFAEALVENALERFFDASRASVNNDRDEDGPDELDEWSDLLAWAILEIAPLFKHRAFEGEEEWRFVSYARSVSPTEMGFSQAGGLVRPYVDISFDPRESVREVWIGPLPPDDRKRAEAAVRLLLARHGIDAFEPERVRHSDIPYRGR